MHGALSAVSRPNGCCLWSCLRSSCERFLVFVRQVPPAICLPRTSVRLFTSVSVLPCVFCTLLTGWLASLCFGCDPCQQPFQGLGRCPAGDQKTEPRRGAGPDAQACFVLQAVAFLHGGAEAVGAVLGPGVGGRVAAVAGILSRGELDPGTTFLSLVYFRRWWWSFCCLHPLRVRDADDSLLAGGFFVAVMDAYKYQSSQCGSLEHWAWVFELMPEDLREMEWQWLQDVQWRLYVDIEKDVELLAWRRLWEQWSVRPTHITKQGVGPKWVSILSVCSVEDQVVLGS